MSKLIYKHLKLIWIITSLILLLVVSYINWHASINYSQKELMEADGVVANRVDRFIETLFQEIYTLPLSEKKSLHCERDLDDHLQKITINNPLISGLVISNITYKPLCSTLPLDKALTSPSPAVRSITGPYTLSIFEQPVYLVQQRLGNFHVGIIILSSILENSLKSSNKITKAITLYDVAKNKEILKIERHNNQHEWVNALNSNHSLQSQSMFATNKLQSIDGMLVIDFENHQEVLRNVWYKQTIVSLFFLLLSCLLYFLVKERFTEHYSLQTAMKLALKNNEFYPVYQPVYDRVKGSYLGAEVLLRWQDHLEEVILPDFFIEEAEITGLIVPITLKIVEIAFKEFHVIATKRPEFHLAFNISAFHFSDKEFFNQFEALMKQYGILPSQIILEITERALLDKNDAIFITKMQALRQAGFGLAVDDYGTGHASISYLQHFPFNYLKIDKLFIKAIGTKAITESLNDAIIQMAKDLHLMIIAEGVETQEQMDYLSANGVGFLQGWYFSKALSMQQLKEFLQ